MLRIKFEKVLTLKEISVGDTTSFLFGSLLIKRSQIGTASKCGYKVHLGNIGPFGITW